MVQQNYTNMPVEANVDLLITYDRPFYHPGSQVNGSIFLYVHSPCQIALLNMNIKGLERTQATHHWITHHTRHSHRNRHNNRNYGRDTTTYIKHHYHTYEHEGSIYNYSFPVYQSNSTILQIGQYQYPFSFTFSNGLSNSFSKQFIDEWGRNAYAYVEYTIECELKFAQNSPPKKTAIELEIVQEAYNMNSAMNKETSALIEQDIKCYCCIGCGTVKGTVKFEKRQYQPGDVATIIVDLDNDNGPDIEELRGELRQVLSVKANQGLSTKTNKVVTVNPQNTIGGSSQAQMKKKEGGQRTFKLTIPGTLDNMVKSDNVTCDYFLEFTAITDFCGKCCQNGSEPTAMVGVNIFRFHGDGGVVQHQQVEQRASIRQLPVGAVTVNNDVYVANLTQQYVVGAPVMDVDPGNEDGGIPIERINVENMPQYAKHS